MYRFPCISVISDTSVCFIFTGAGDSTLDCILAQVTALSANMEAFNSRLNQLESQVVPPAQNLAGIMAQRRAEAPSATAAVASVKERCLSVRQAEVEAEDFPAPSCVDSCDWDGGVRYGDGATSSSVEVSICERPTLSFGK